MNNVALKSLAVAGKYRARATHITVGYSTNGLPRFEIIWAVMGGEMDGHEIVGHHYTTDSAYPRTLAELRAAGWDAQTDLLAGDPMDALPGEVTIDVAPDEISGHVRLRRVLGPVREGERAMTEAARAQIASDFLARTKRK